MEAEFFHEVGAVFFNGLEADTEKVCNLHVLVTFFNQLQDFPFPLGQGVPRGSNRGSEHLAETPADFERNVRTCH